MKTNQILQKALFLLLFITFFSENAFTMWKPQYYQKTTSELLKRGLDKKQVDEIINKLKKADPKTPKEANEQFAKIQETLKTQTFTKPDDIIKKIEEVQSEFKSEQKKSKEGSENRPQEKEKLDKENDRVKKEQKELKRKQPEFFNYIKTGKYKEALRVQQALMQLGNIGIWGSLNVAKMKDFKPADQLVFYISFFEVTALMLAKVIITDSSTSNDINTVSKILSSYFDPTKTEEKEEKDLLIMISKNNELAVAGLLKRRQELNDFGEEISKSTKDDIIMLKNRLNNEINKKKIIDQAKIKILQNRINELDKKEESYDKSMKEILKEGPKGFTQLLRGYDLADKILKEDLEGFKELLSGYDLEELKKLQNLELLQKLLQNPETSDYKKIFQERIKMLEDNELEENKKL